MLLLLLACSTPLDTGDPDADGYTDQDCDPSDPLVFPNAQELCDGLDNDCDGVVDETFDLDQDGFLADDEAGCRVLGVPLDCDDLDASVNPAAEELCNGVDDDCSGWVDDAVDEDQDGYGRCDDCDDGDPERSPGLEDVCDGIDNDCDGRVDGPDDHDGDGLGECLDCDDEDPYNGPHLEEVCDGADNDCDGQVDEGFDLDEDGFTTCQGDCDDLDALVHPGAFEACDGVDNDCDEATVEDADLDGDGFRLCDEDCDDDDATLFPGAPEECNGADDDCNGWVDDALACFGCVDDGTYLFCSLTLTQEEAAEACEGFGRSLVRIDDADENAVVRAGAQSVGGGNPWLGLTDSDIEGTWVWADGSALSWSAWHSGEPNDYGAGEDCVELYLNYGTWNDARCSIDRAFVCE